MWCVVLIVLGVLFEVTGLGLLAWQLWRVQRREFGMPAWWTALRRRVLRLKRRSQTWQSEFGRETGDTASTAEHSGVERRVAGDTLEERVEGLEANLVALERGTQTRFQQQAQRQDQLEVSIRESRAELQRQQEKREGEQRERLRESMTLQWWGTGLFFIGAVLAGVANGVC
jgi:hypothetical protein